MTPFDEQIAELERLAGKLGRPKKVLLVDDDDVFRESVKLALESRGKIVREAADAIMAIQIVSREQIDLVITDLRMAGVDGAELIRRLREHFPNGPKTMLLTGYINDERLSVLVNDPGCATTILAKPINFQTLEQYVDLLTRE